ncbi:hypothetical protein Vadar_013466 [Vaccinium darrowii]|uniref:Uncharacterized protein n=1 Tax=Vaccinium darrowii TaxID=229202 RepID=A0ACB7XQH3_9ERIC|nr:hypothetical protein Vadar_013466 [Vaccinium darrowii]
MRSTSQQSKSKVDIWSEDELDFLWIGVRRHGHGNRDAMIQDPRLIFSESKRDKDLSLKWETKLLKIMHGSAFPAKHPEASLFPSKSNEMMAWALHRSRLGGDVPDLNEELRASYSKDTLTYHNPILLLTNALPHWIMNEMQ